VRTAGRCTTASPAEAGRRQETAAKLDRVRGWLEDAGRSGALFESQANFAWLTAGGRNHVSLGDDRGVAFVLVTADDAYVITANIEAPRIAKEEIEGLPFALIEYPWHEPDRVNHIVGELCDVARAVTDVGSSDFPPAGGELARLRYDLLVSELERYRALGRDAARAVEFACREARPGDSELDVAARVADECVRRDILPLVNLVAADRRIAAYRHPIPTTNRVATNLLVALTGRRHGLHASLTRMVSFGTPDDDLAKRHRAVQRVDARMILASRPGATLADVVQTAINQYESEGFADEWRLHHQGGLTGYGGREVFGTPSAGYELGPNQAVAWNPSITR
jgi:Xaa-Pro aminopeptidase